MDSKQRRKITRKKQWLGELWRRAHKKRYSASRRKTETNIDASTSEFSSAHSTLFFFQRPSLREPTWRKTLFRLFRRKEIVLSSRQKVFDTILLGDVWMELYLWNFKAWEKWLIVPERDKSNFFTDRCSIVFDEIFF